MQCSSRLTSPLAPASPCCVSTLRVSYPSPAAALMVYNSVVVDEEIRSDRIYRHLRLEDNVIAWSGCAKTRARG